MLGNSAIHAAPGHTARLLAPGSAKAGLMLTETPLSSVKMISRVKFEQLKQLVLRNTNLIFVDPDIGWIPLDALGFLVGAIHAAWHTKLRLTVFFGGCRKFAASFLRLVTNARRNGCLI